jgi:RNA polymerase sigma-70 factor (ECF subfamily)
MDDQAIFLPLFLRHEAELRAFIGSVVHDPQAREDVLQEAALTLWREFRRYDRSRSFGAWARGVAAKKLLEQRKSNRRAPVYLSPEAIQRLVEAGDRAESRPKLTLEALEHCVERLPARSRRLLALRYGQKQTLETIAAQVEATAGAVYQALSRLRARLRDCMRRWLLARGEA